MASRYSCVLLTSDRLDLAGPAEEYAKAKFDVRHVSGHARHEREFPVGAAEALATGKVDILLNYLAPMIVPEQVLQNVGREAINFHPASPAWPGIGSASYALYQGDLTFGATAHRMTTTIDGGEIVRVASFPVRSDDTCETLFERALRSSLTLFQEVCDELSRTGHVAASGDRWERRAITRAEFERWMTLSVSDPTDEIAKKVRALAHPRFPGPFFVIDGHRVEVDASRSSDE